MNKSVVCALCALLSVAAVAAPRGPAPRRHAPKAMHHFRPAPRHHHHHHAEVGLVGGFVGGVVGSLVYDAIVRPAPVVVSPAPVVVAQPAPVVVSQPAPVVVSSAPVVVEAAPAAQVERVWVGGRYVDQVQANGSIVRVWQPGHWEERLVAVR